jgi:hypothetical protein
MINDLIFFDNKSVLTTGECDLFSSYVGTIVDYINANFELIDTPVYWINPLFRNTSLRDFEVNPNVNCEYTTTFNRQTMEFRVTVAGHYADVMIGIYVPFNSQVGINKWAIAFSRWVEEYAEDQSAKPPDFAYFMDMED